MSGAGPAVKYPYSMTGKFLQFPWKYHWQNGRYVRFLALTLLITTPMIYKIHKGVHSPGNVRQWEQIRRKREHTHFDPVH